jgi:hypothetical protein
LPCRGRDLERVRQAEAELDHAMVEERDAALEAPAHQDAVELDQQVVGQPRRQIAYWQRVT